MIMTRMEAGAPDCNHSVLVFVPLRCLKSPGDLSIFCEEVANVKIFLTNDAPALFSRNVE
jgi:hypothetical protein